MQARLSALLLLSLAAAGCDKGNDDHGAPPPPAPSAPPSTGMSSGGPSGDGGANACAGGGGTDSDAVSAPFFPRTLGDSREPAPGATRAPGSAPASAFCLDTADSVRTFGDHGKLTLEDVCTTGFDGECEVYKSFGLKRAVTLRYIGAAGAGGATVEVVLSTFDSVTGAYAMFTKRVIADSDPTDPTATKPIAGLTSAAADARGALGTGKAYVWRNDSLLELTYNDENASPEQLAKDSAPVLVALGTQVAGRLPAGTLPACAAALPAAHLVPNGIQFYKKDLMGIPGAGAGAVGYYVDGSKRWRALSMVDADQDKIKASFRALHAKPGALPVTGVTGADEAFHVVYQLAKELPKTEWVIARKTAAGGAQVEGIGDEEFALTKAAADSAPDALAKARVSRDDALSLLNAWPATPAGSSPLVTGDAGSGKSSGRGGNGRSFFRFRRSSPLTTGIVPLTFARPRNRGGTGTRHEQSPAEALQATAHRET